MGQNDAYDGVGIYIEEIQRTSFTFTINIVVWNTVTYKTCYARRIYCSTRRFFPYKDL